MRGHSGLLRMMNERLVLNHLREHGRTSRVDLARVTGLSKPTVSAAMSGLVEAGLVMHVGEMAGRPGPTTSLYDLNPDAAYVLGVDIGREWIRVGVADMRGQFRARKDGRNSARTAAELVRRARSLAHRAADEAGVEWTSITTAVVGSPGVFDPGSGGMQLAPNLPDWGRPGLVDRLRDSLHIELTLENDVNLAAVGEHAYGEGRGKQHFVLISIGTGVGMGIVIDGQLYTGFQGAAGEIGYLPAPESHDLTHGSMEAAIAAASIARHAQASGLELSSAKEVFAAAGAGDPRALRVVRAEGERIGGLIVAVAAVLDPEIVVLGGGVGRNVLLMREAITERIAESGPLRPEIVASGLGESGVLYGAIARALDRAWTLVFARR
jgi:predicted NBD/HSP70 family sugar kinase